MNLKMAIHKSQSGQTLITVLILLFVGGLIIISLLAFMSTALRANQVYEKKMNQIYAADAGIEDAINRIIHDDASLQSLSEGESYDYSLPESVNNLSVDISVTRLSLVQGIIGADEYKEGQPHEDWIQMEFPSEEPVRNYDEGWVEYAPCISFDYGGKGSRQVESIGIIFSPGPSNENMIVDPYNETPTPVITMDGLESRETKITSHGFAFIWRWGKGEGPIFDKKHRDGALSFKFKVLDPSWNYEFYFVWATVKEQDISYITSANYYKWLIDATSGDTTVRAVVIDSESESYLITWEINPPE